MLDYNQVTPGKFIVLDGQPYECLVSQTSKKSRQKASNQTKLKNLITGKVTEKAFHQSDNLEEADISKKTVIFIYENRGEYWFHEDGNPKERFKLDADMIGDQSKFLKEKTGIDALVFNEEVIGISLPIKMDLLVTEAAPAVKGNTAQGATKQVVVETGASITVPIFVNQGDVIRINTESGEYVERASKSNEV